MKYNFLLLATQLESGGVNGHDKDQVQKKGKKMETVTLACDSKTWKLRSASLCACSPVLEGILAESRSETERLVRMDDVKPETVAAFVRLVQLTDHSHSEERPTSKELAESTRIVMPLVHKYDCGGLLRILQAALREYPNVDGVEAMMEYDPDDVLWWNDEIRGRLVAKLRPIGFLLESERQKAKCESRVNVKKMANVSSAALQELLSFKLWNC
jgi:hypothetical protein